MTIILKWIFKEWGVGVEWFDVVQNRTGGWLS